MGQAFDLYIAHHQYGKYTNQNVYGYYGKSTLIISKIMYDQIGNYQNQTCCRNWKAKKTIRKSPVLNLASLKAAARTQKAKQIYVI